MAMSVSRPGESVARRAPGTSASMRAMAAAVCQCGAKRVLVPINHCENYVVGVPDQPVSQLVAAAAQKVKELCSTIG